MRTGALAAAIIAIVLSGCASQQAAIPDSPLPGSIGAVVGARGADVVVTAVGEPARRAGLRVGDVVRSYNGAEVLSARQFERLVIDTAPGAMATIEVVRDGKPVRLELRAIQMDTTARV